MKYRILFVTLAALATPAAAGDLPRLAQWSGGTPSYEVLTIVRSAGLDPIGHPLRRGPMYVLRAIDDDDREVRVVVDARYGEIVSITPIMTESRDVPLRELPSRRMAPYERMHDGYERPGYRSAPPIIYESDPPMERPRAVVPDDPRHAGRALPPPGRGGETPRVIYSDRSPPDEIERRPMSSPRPMARGTPQASIDTDAPGAGGPLPAPPERFPQRVAPAPAKPAPAKRAAAAPPKQAPLPKPRPTEGAQVDAAPPPTQPASSPPVPERKSAADQMPH